MATTDKPRSTTTERPRQAPWPARDGTFRFTVEQFYQLDELGYFEDRHVELVGGVIFEMTINPPHATATTLADKALQLIFAEGWLVREEKPLDLGRRSLLEPDLVVVAGSARDYSVVHPKTAALLIEISDATLRKDRTIKAHLYAQAGLLDYWILNLVDRQLEVHRNPGPDPARRGRFRYAEVSVVPSEGRMSPLAAPGSSIAVADMLP